MKLVAFSRKTVMADTDRASPRQKPTGRRSGWRAASVAAALIAATITPVAVNAADGFSDTSGTTHESAIEALEAMGVFAGTECDEGLFCPHDPIKRWVMAVWLIRALGDEPATVETSRFVDVDADEWWSPYTEQLAEREITKGCETEPLSYCPSKSVTRAHMAAFLVRAFDLEAAPPAGFVDTAGNTLEEDIDSLAAAGITKGCETEPLSYCPSRSVSRAQMAAFLHRALVKQAEAVPDPEATQVSDDVPDVELTDISTGATVNFRSLVTGDKPVLLWFFAHW